MAVLVELKECCVACDIQYKMGKVYKLKNWGGYLIPLAQPFPWLTVPGHCHAYHHHLALIILENACNSCCTVNLRPAGGCLNTPLWFFADSKKTAARSAAGFTPTLSPIFLPTVVEVSILGHARSGHQVRSSDHTLQKLYNRAPATVFEGKLWNFWNMIRSSVPTKCISQIFDIGDLRSGHFRDPHYKSMGKN